MPVCEICKNKKTKFFHKKNGYDYYECPRCITLFLYPKPSFNQINTYYKQNFKYTAGVTNENQIRANAKSILSDLRKLNAEGNSLLDVGSGYGYLLEEAKRSKFKPTGIEPSKLLYSASINRLIGTDIQNTVFEKYFTLNGTKKFDFITIIHTVEHVFNPKKLIYESLKHLNPLGILYIETPNLDSHLFRAEKYNYTFLTPPDHIWLFSKKSFYFILKKNYQIKIEKTHSYSSPEHFMGILKNKLKILNSKSETILKIKNSNIKTSHVSNFKNSDFEFVSRFGFRISDFKYLIFDKFLAPVLTPLLNIGVYGSTLGLYIRKK